MADVDIGASDAFYSFKTTDDKAKRKTVLVDLQNTLMNTTAPFLDVLKIPEDRRLSTPYKDFWLDWTKKRTDTAVAAKAKAKANSEVVVMEYNEETGQKLNQQLNFDKDGKQSAQTVKLPWRDWYKDRQHDMGALAADKNATVAMLHSLHERFDMVSQSVDVLLTDKQVSAVATAAVKAGDIALPPCNPKASKVLDANPMHPYAVTVLTKLLRPGPIADEPVLTRTRRLYIGPEFIYPQQIEGSDPAVAATQQIEGSDPAVAANWQWEGTETMNPFWAARRMTRAQLTKEYVDRKAGLKPLRFNCELKTYQVSAVNVGLVDQKIGNTTRMFDVPFIINNKEMEEGEELIIEITPPKNEGKKQKQRVWKDEYAAQKAQRNAQNK